MKCIWYGKYDRYFDSFRILKYAKDSIQSYNTGSTIIEDRGLMLHKSSDENVIVANTLNYFFSDMLNDIAKIYHNYHNNI